jgi:hypothetical protein
MNTGDFYDLAYFNSLFSAVGFLTCIDQPLQAVPQPRPVRFEVDARGRRAYGLPQK